MENDETNQYDDDDDDNDNDNDDVEHLKVDDMQEEDDNDNIEEEDQDGEEMGGVSRTENGGGGGGGELLLLSLGLGLGDDDDDDDNDIDNDPRVQSLFAQAATIVSHPMDVEHTTAVVNIDEHAILNCFQWSMEQHNSTSSLVGFWVAPNEQDADEEEDYDDEQEQASNAAIRQAYTNWKPASLPLPAWAIP